MPARVSVNKVVPGLSYGDMLNAIMQTWFNERFGVLLGRNVYFFEKQCSDVANLTRFISAFTYGFGTKDKGHITSSSESEGVCGRLWGTWSVDLPLIDLCEGLPIFDGCFSFGDARG